MLRNKIGMPFPMGRWELETKEDFTTGLNFYPPFFHFISELMGLLLAFLHDESPCY